MASGIDFGAITDFIDLDAAVCGGCDQFTEPMFICINPTSNDPCRTSCIDVVAKSDVFEEFDVYVNDSALDGSNLVLTDTEGNMLTTDLCPAVVLCETPLVVTTDGNVTGVAQSGTNDHIVDITLLGDVAGNILSISPNGGLGVTCDDIVDCETPLLLTTDGNATGVTLSGTNEHTVNIVVTSTDADQIGSIGTDGGTLVTCEDVLGCVNIEGAGDITVTGTGTPADPFVVSYTDVDAPVVVTGGDNTTVTGSGTTADPYVINTCCASVISSDGTATVTPGAGSTTNNPIFDISVTPSPDLVLTTDGNTTGVTLSGTGDHTANIVVTSTDADNILTIGADGGTFLDCDTVCECIIGDLTACEGGSPSDFCAQVADCVDIPVVNKCGGSAIADTDQVIVIDQYETAPVSGTVTPITQDRLDDADCGWQEVYLRFNGCVPKAYLPLPCGTPIAKIPNVDNNDGTNTFTLELLGCDSAPANAGDCVTITTSDGETLTGLVGQDITTFQSSGVTASLSIKNFVTAGAVADGFVFDFDRCAYTRNQPDWYDDGSAIKDCFSVRRLDDCTHKAYDDTPMSRCITITPKDPLCGTSLNPDNCSEVEPDCDFYLFRNNNHGNNNDDDISNAVFMPTRCVSGGTNIIMPLYSQSYTINIDGVPYASGGNIYADGFPLGSGGQPITPNDGTPQLLDVETVDQYGLCARHSEYLNPVGPGAYFQDVRNNVFASGNNCDQIRHTTATFYNNTINGDAHTLITAVSTLSDVCRGTLMNTVVRGPTPTPDNNGEFLVENVPSPKCGLFQFDMTSERGPSVEGQSFPSAGQEIMDKTQLAKLCC